jgi:hypothetical protein
MMLLLLFSVGMEGGRLIVVMRSRELKAEVGCGIRIVGALKFCVYTQLTRKIFLLLTM